MDARFEIRFIFDLGKPLTSLERAIMLDCLEKAKQLRSGRRRKSQRAIVLGDLQALEHVVKGDQP